MNIAPVAYRYARSLMQLAIEQNQLEAVQEDMRLIANTCEGSRDLVLLLKSPVIKGDKKDKILDRVFAGQIGTKVHDGVVTCVVTSAAPLDEEARKKVSALAAEKFPGKSITLSEKVDPSLIGGVIVRIGDEQYDGSVSRRLSDLRRKFSENPYIPEI